MALQEQVSTAKLRYLGTSAQKARLVIDLIRGKPVEEALAILRYTKKAVAPEIGALVDSAIANARQKNQEIDIDRLFVQTAVVDGGPSLKRIRPAPMGRAFKILKRMCHVTVALGQKVVAAPTAATDANTATGGAGSTRTARAGTAGKGAGRAAGKAVTKKAAPARKKAVAKKSPARAKKTAKEKSRS